jgi:RNA-binding protein YlmH
MSQVTRAEGESAAGDVRLPGLTAHLSVFNDLAAYIEQRLKQMGRVAVILNAGRARRW